MPEARGAGNGRHTVCASGAGMTTPYELADCPACAATEAHELADRDAIARQIERLWRFQLRRLRPGTPVHRLIDRVAFSQRPPVRVVACAACGTVYRDPRERERTLLEVYAGERPDTDALAALHEAQLPFYRRRARRLTRIHGRAGRVLEVGSYVGAFLAAARDEGWDARGLDVNETVNAFARARGFPVETGPAEAVEATADGAVDAVALWNCFDQLADPRRALGSIHARLRPGGVLAVRVPNGGLYRACIDGEGGVGSTGGWVLAMNNLLGFPYRHGFTPASLAALLRRSGFDTVRVRADTLVPVADAWTRRWAAVEERLAKAGMRVALRGRLAPWFEVYAVRR